MVAMLLVVGHADQLAAATCGSAILLETDAPAVFDGVDDSQPIVARFWAAGTGGANRATAGCAAGCELASGSLCAGAGDCMAVAGVNWLNATCGAAGHLPSRTIFLIEQETASSGGRWAAFNLARNSTDANTDLDAAATSACGGCSSVVSPLIGSSGVPGVSNPTVVGSHLTATVTWSVPVGAAQALSNGTNVVTSYAVFSRVVEGTPPPATGSMTGWTFEADLEPDGGANGGYSTNTSASVDVDLPIGERNVIFAIGLNFDGTGNPTADPNVQASSVLSDQSTPVAVSVESLLFEDGFESGDTSEWSATTP